MRLPDWVRRPLGRRREPAPEPAGLVAVLRAAVAGDEEDLERLAVARAHERARREGEREEQRQRDEARQRAEGSAAFIRQAIRRYGAYFPNDWT
jgi:hypothetical protein